MSPSLMLSFISADPSLGRIDQHSLSQDTLMELLIADLSNKQKICGPPESPLEISDWKGVIFDETNAITDIQWAGRFLEGSLEFKWLPSSITDFSVMRNFLQGTVDFTCLPHGLQLLYLADNEFEGTVDLTRLPSGIQQLLLQKNKFYGVTDFSHLPKSLRHLNVMSTQLEGGVHDFHGILVISDSFVKDMRKS